MEDWKARAEKAEAELARLQAVRDFNSHPNAPDPDSAVHRAMELRLEAAEAELARLREPAGDVGNLCDRLRGIYRVPITDGLGPVGCGEEPHNPNEFVRRFETPPIQREAAALLLRQAGEIERWRGLRDAIAELRGYGPEWPEHGNVPLAIAAGYSLTLTRATSAEALLREAAEAAAKAVMKFKHIKRGRYYPGYHEDMRDFVRKAVLAKLEPAPQPREDTYPDRVSMEPWPYSGHAPGGNRAGD